MGIQRIASLWKQIRPQWQGTRLHIGILVLAALLSSSSPLLALLTDDFHLFRKQSIREWLLERRKWTIKLCGDLFQCSDCVHPMDDGHIAMTYSALCILVILGDGLSRLNRPALLRALKALQQEDGCFSSTGDSESDMRFLFCACAISTFLNDWSGVDVEKARKYIVGAMGFDFAYGQSPCEESHGGSTYCAVASLALMGRLGDLGFPARGLAEAAGYQKANGAEKPALTEQATGLLHWLVQRQVSGFQGRINKDQDSCYSWWIGSSLQMLGYFDMVELVHLQGFILSCQDAATGGFAKHPNHHPDALHTYFSLCGLAFAGAPGLHRPHCALGITLNSARRLPHLNIPENI